MSTPSQDSAPIAVKINLLDREFTVGCEPAEKDALLAAAQTLDAKMREIRGGARMAQLDRVLVLAALSFASDLHSERKVKATRDSQLTEMLQSLNHKIDGFAGESAA